MGRTVKMFLAVAVVVGVALISFAGVLTAHGIAGHTWDWGVPNFAEQYRLMADHHFSTWDAYFETGRYHYFKLELLYWQLITPFAGLGGEVMSKVLPLVFVIASGLAMLPLARYLRLNWFYAALAALFYAFSPYTFSRVVAGHMPMLAGFALIPLVLLTYFKLVQGIREHGRIGLRTVIMCGLLLGLTSLHPSVGVGTVVMLGLLSMYFLVRGPARGKVLASLGCIFALALFMNIHFMAPFLADYLGKGAIRHGWGLSASAKGEVTVDTELPMREGFHQSTSQPMDATMLLDLRPGMDTEYVFTAPAGMRGLWIASSFMLAGLALCSFLARRGRVEAGGLFLVAVTGILLVCGSRTPFGLVLYQGVLKTFLPILFAAFSNTTRWLPLIVTAYALLIFQLPQYWEERGLRWSGTVWLRVALAATVLVFISPFLGQKLISHVAPDTVPQPLGLKFTPIHPEDAAVFAFLRDQRAEGRVAYLPPVGISWPGDSPYSYEWSSAYSPKGFFLAFYNNPLGSEIISTMYAEQPSPHLDRLFGLASVRYLVYPRYDFFVSYQDFQPGYQGLPMVDGFKNYKPVLDRTLALQEGLTPDQRFRTVDIYRNPMAAPEVLAADQLLAVADASGKGANLVAPSLPDVVGLPLYHPGQVLTPAGEDPQFLALLGIVLGGKPERTLLTDRRGKRQAYIFEGNRVAPPSLEFRRFGPTTCRVRLTGVAQGFPLVFQETFHAGWKAYLVPLTGGRASGVEDGLVANSLPGYRVFLNNQDDQADGQELAAYLKAGWVSTLGDGKEKTRSTRIYGSGGKTVGGNIETYRVGFVGKRFLTSLQNDNLSAVPLGATWREGAFVPATADDREPDGEALLSPASWRVEGADAGRALPWPEAFHWQANGFANVWWLEPGLLDALGPYKDRYVRQNPKGGVDMELIIEFRPQRFYQMGLAVSALTVALCLLTLAATTVKRHLRRKTAHG